LTEGYKVIHEKTVVDPMKIVDDKREGKPSFGDIRNTLQHSRRGESHVELEKLNKIKKDLYCDCIDLLEREIIFIHKVTEVSLNDIKEKHTVFAHKKEKAKQNKTRSEKRAHKKENKPTFSSYSQEKLK
jgi:hypothetical protein